MTRRPNPAQRREHGFGIAGMSPAGKACAGDDVEHGSVIAHRPRAVAFAKISVEIDVRQHFVPLADPDHRDRDSFPRSCPQVASGESPGRQSARGRQSAPRQWAENAVAKSVDGFPTPERWPSSPGAQSPTAFAHRTGDVNETLSAKDGDVQSSGERVDSKKGLGVGHEVAPGAVCSPYLGRNARLSPVRPR